MKYFALILFFLSNNVFAQKSAFFRVDSLPKQGILLDKGWKCQTGDNLDWAKPDFDDSSWAVIDPTKDIAALPEIFNSQIKWLRFDFEIKNHLPGPLGVAVTQAGASEIYLNGRLIHEFGRFDTDPNKVKAYDPLHILIHLPADSIGKYHLAVRYALQPNIRYTHVFGLTRNCLFHATLYNLVPAQQAQLRFRIYYKGIDIFISGLVFMLFVLHTAFYLYQKNNKLYLLLAVYLLCTLITRICKIIGQFQHIVEDRYYTLNFANLALSITIVLVGTVYYRIVKERFDKYYLGLVAYFVMYVFVSAFTYGDSNWQNSLLLLGSIYGFIVLVRLIRHGIKNGVKGYITLGASIFFAIVGLVCITTAMRFLNYNITPTGYNELRFGISPYLIEAVFNFGSISIPIGLSLFMGILGNETNKALNKQLIENDELKNKAIEQEHEKQLILATQNEILEKQVMERTAELNQSLETLKSTQNQLIQSEKLASLGELTAGIAHEIQNPLNFVNNFSELSVGIAQELNEELNKPDLDKPYIEELLFDLTQNQTKINHHGKRASSIVKGMLEHSRASAGSKELADINRLAEEYLRLSYHGLRAKDKAFNAHFKSNFDENLPKLAVIPQDMGRVLLNLINNAFYAVNEKNKQNNAGGFQPTVTVSTFTKDGKVGIKVTDNGNGIPEHILQKIFQPFFTTKPTGEGTGLGLSLSYDIIVKGHNGILDVETKEGLGTTFTILLPNS